MKVKHENRTITRSEDFEEHRFNIAPNPIAFKILSKNLYNNPIRAIIRELSTNARDSHIEAGNEEIPFKVTLPNLLSQEFIIRDYGTGLSHEEVLKVYSTYFFSSRSDSDKFTGCWGLGSKSPFAYTDSYTVTSFRDGEKRIYQLYLGSDGGPQLSLLSTSKTNEPQGLEVKISVDSSDINAFVKNAQKVYRYFDLKPKVVGNSGFTHSFPEEEAIVKGEDWLLLKRQNTYTTLNTAVMGNVAYPIGYFDTLPPMVGHQHILFFDIGELEVTASREELHLSEVTKEAISNKIRKVNKELHSKIYNEIEKKETYWESCIYLNETGLFSVAKEIFKHGRVVRPTIKLSTILGKDVKETIPTAYIGDCPPYKLYGGFDPQDTYIFHGDMSNPGYRLKPWMADNNIKKVVVINLPEKDMEVFYSNAEVPVRLRKRISDLPKRKVLTSKTNKSKDQILYKSPDHSNLERIEITDAVNKEGIYVNTNYSHPTELTTHIETINILASRYNKLIFYIPATMKNRIDHQWQNANEFVDEKLREILEDETVVYAAKIPFHLLSSYHRVNKLEVLKQISERLVAYNKDDSDIDRLVKEYEKISEITHDRELMDFRKAVLLEQNTKFYIEEVLNKATFEDIEEIYEQLLKKYPLLEQFVDNRYARDKFIEALVEYIILVQDSKKEN